MRKRCDLGLSAFIRLPRHKLNYIRPGKVITTRDLISDKVMSIKDTTNSNRRYIISPDACLCQQSKGFDGGW
jgi:hypothetical protein